VGRHWGDAAPRDRHTLPEQVATAVVHAIRRNKAEIVVASVPTRVGTAIGAAAPRLIAAMQRHGGSAEAMQAAAEAQRRKR
jgi:hypothetical protein